MCPSTEGVKPEILPAARRKTKANRNLILPTSRRRCKYKTKSGLYKLIQVQPLQLSHDSQSAAVPSDFSVASSFSYTLQPPACFTELPVAIISR
ncbi:hypothetical protein E2C01_061563 [Portunus trituberculatus]|uniref:Uncharacterized protein n=1 Tax=Portunus trituberculatus TaxID=210409 RepID=A0A5B7HER0_PORTR|nr:hypothetical protein [Portunus trituberculatus]